MKSYFVLSFTLAVAAMASVVVLCIRDVGPDSTTDELERGRELDRVIAASQARYEVMSLLVDDLADGTISLSSAARQTCEQYDDQELTLRVAREKFGGDTKNEVVCRHLLFRVAMLLQHSPERHHAVMERLEGEFNQLYPLTKQPMRHRLRGYEGAPDPSL